MNDTLKLVPPRRVDLRRLAPFLAVALAVVTLDQASKAVIRAELPLGHSRPLLGELLRLSHVENSGAAFGILQGAGDLLLVVAILGVAAIAAYILFAPVPHRWHAPALALVLGGAAGNLVDRVTRGTVTDFIDPVNYPAFNLADSAIVVGVAVLLAAAYVFPGETAAPASHGRDVASEDRRDR